MNAEDIVKRLKDAANEWVISHNGAKENSCGLVALAREAANLIEYLQAQLAESQRRERAAVEDMKAIIRNVGSHKSACDICSKPCGYEGLQSDWCDHFRWRGTKEGGIDGDTSAK